ncbi:MAG TPA: efflux RND transporter periplasmic adaptor subunit [Terracidiphilus sp.]|nr:efflux RND transporter periplasmic adaptor subunit [Terracidiphilus sp.]
MNQERKQTVRLWIWRGLAVLLIVVFFAVRALTRDQLQVRVAAAADVQLVSTISTNDRVEPEANFEVHSPIATTVKAVYVQPGDQVAAGKVLLVLDDVEARAREATAESGVRAAQAALEAVTQNGTQQERQATAADVLRQRLERDNARRDLDALTKLNSTGAASSSEVAAARQRLDAAEVNLRALDQSQNSRYSHAEIERARAALADAEANRAAMRQVVAQTVVRAPVAGTVYSLDARATDFVEEGKLLLQLADLHHERVRAYFDEPEIGRLAVGQKIQIKWDAKPGRIWNGHIERTPVTVINLGTRSVGEVLVKIDDADGDLLPDTNVNVTVTLSSEPNSLSVPREALRLENGRPYVFKVVKGGLQRTYVTTGTINLTQVAILSGLASGDLVATGTLSGQPLQEGVPIKVVR